MGVEPKVRWLAFAGLAMLGTAMFFAGRASMPASPPAEPGAEDEASSHVSAGERTATPAPQNPVLSPVQNPSGVIAGSVASVLTMHSTLGEGFEAALARFGPTNPDLISAANEAVRFCAAGLQPENEDRKMERIRDGWAESENLPSADFPYSADPIDTLLAEPRRTRAREKLVARCAGFDARAFVARLQTSVVDRATAGLLVEDTNLRVLAARAAVNDSHDRFALSHAGHILIEQDQLPLQEIFAGPPPVGKVESIPLWWHATALSTCGSQLGCGPDSLTTLVFCSQNICDPGENYQQALAGALSPRDYRTVTGFSNWLGHRPR